MKFQQYTILLFKIFRKTYAINSLISCSPILLYFDNSKCYTFSEIISLGIIIRFYLWSCVSTSLHIAMGLIIHLHFTEMSWSCSSDRPRHRHAMDTITALLDHYSISQEICTRFCCALFCCGYAIVHNEFTGSIYPYSSGLLCWHWGNR